MPSPARIARKLRNYLAAFGRRRPGVLVEDFSRVVPLSEALMLEGLAGRRAGDSRPPSVAHKGDGADDATDEVSSMWTDADADPLTLSSDSEGEEEGPSACRRPRARPRPLDGSWVLCSPKGRTADWLDALKIEGGIVVDGCGGTCYVVETPQGPVLRGGLLRRYGAALFRLGKSGCVQVYLRSA